MSTGTQQRTSHAGRSANTRAATHPLDGPGKPSSILDMALSRSGRAALAGRAAAAAASSAAGAAAAAGAAGGRTCMTAAYSSFTCGAGGQRQRTCEASRVCASAASTERGMAAKCTRLARKLPPQAVGARGGAETRQARAKAAQSANPKAEARLPTPARCVVAAARCAVAARQRRWPGALAGAALEGCAPGFVQLGTAANVVRKQLGRALQVHAVQLLQRIARRRGGRRNGHAATSAARRHRGGERTKMPDDDVAVTFARASLLRIG